MAWTDERLDDLAGQMAAGLERVEGEIRDLRSEMHSEFRAVRVEMHSELRTVRTEIDSLRTLTIRFGAALMIAMAGMIATLIGIAVTGTLG